MGGDKGGARGGGGREPEPRTPREKEVTTFRYKDGAMFLFFIITSKNIFFMVVLSNPRPTLSCCCL